MRLPALALLVVAAPTAAGAATPRPFNFQNDTHFQSALSRMAEGEPTLKVVLRWHRPQQRRCQVEVHSSAEGPFADPWSLHLAQRLKQILA